MNAVSSPPGRSVLALPRNDRSLPLEDTIECFNGVLLTRLTPAEKADLVVFIRCDLDSQASQTQGRSEHVTREVS